MCLPALEIENMRIILRSVVAAAVIAIAGAAVPNHFERSAAVAFSTSSVRL
jgi:hypothetical protein